MVAIKRGRISSAKRSTERPGGGDDDARSARRGASRHPHAGRGGAGARRVTSALRPARPAARSRRLLRVGAAGPGGRADRWAEHCATLGGRQWKVGSTSRQVALQCRCGAHDELDLMSSTNRNPHRRGIARRVDKTGREQYRGTAYDKRAKRHLYGPWTYTLAEARAWRVDALAGLEKGTRSADRGVTVRVAAEQFVAGIESGAIRNRSGGVYKPSAVHGIRRELNNRVVVAFGAVYLREVTLPDVQRWADQLAGQGLA